MEYNTLKAAVRGISRDGKSFVAMVRFTVVPPKAGEAYCGNGYYMIVEEISDLFQKREEVVDARYAQTTDIEVLAERYIESHYGKNAKEVSYSVIES